MGLLRVFYFFREQIAVGLSVFLCTNTHLALKIDRHFSKEFLLGLFKSSAQPSFSFASLFVFFFPSACLSISLCPSPCWEKALLLSSWPALFVCVSWQQMLLATHFSFFPSVLVSRRNRKVSWLARLSETIVLQENLWC